MSSLHILVVEDFECFRKLVCALLRESGDFRITQVSDGLEALHKFHELNPDLVLLDIGLP